METFIFLPIYLSDEILDVTYTGIQYENTINDFMKYRGTV